MSWFEFFELIQFVGASDVDVETRITLAKLLRRELSRAENNLLEIAGYVWEAPDVDKKRYASSLRTCRKLIGDLERVRAVAEREFVELSEV